jgi:hypothetical protein
MIGIIKGILDEVEGTQHYGPCLDRIVSYAFELYKKKEGLRPAENLNSETFRGTSGASASGKKYPTKPQEPICKFGFKNGFVYYDPTIGVFVNILNQNGGKGSVEVIGYDKENPKVKAEEAENINWFKKYENKSTLTGIKAAINGGTSAYLRSKEKWTEVGEYATCQFPSSFVASSHFNGQNATSVNPFVVAAASTANLSDNVELSATA